MTKDQKEKEIYFNLVLKNNSEELKNKLLQDCNESGLPLEAIYYLVKDLFRDVSDTYENILRQKELKEEKESSEE